MLKTDLPQSQWQSFFNKHNQLSQNNLNFKAKPNLTVDKENKKLLYVQQPTMLINSPCTMRENRVCTKMSYGFCSYWVLCFIKINHYFILIPIAFNHSYIILLYNVIT